MDVTIAKSVSQALDDQRKAARAFHRACIGEGHKNLRQAAGIHLPMALLADFPLAIGLVKDMAGKLASPKERDRLRELGRAELSAMGITAIEEERVRIDVVLDAIPGPEDGKSLLALGLKRARKDASGRRFAGTASQVQVSALVARLGGQVTVLEEADPAGGSGADGEPGVVQAGDPPAAETTSISEEPPIPTASESPSGIETSHAPATEDAASKSSPVPMPMPRPAPRLPVPPRPGLPDERRNSISSPLLRGQERSLEFARGFPDDPTKSTAPE
ncbi:hypothetical protein [Bosea sp. (in: a-proteobacteria)]|uniref:hypothetical protein n=1 Tax=Bosea sp. (in: a-proteobacteria) TaxID=1871050 RepID=UPI002632D70B|nr:hypothetical protein [Bosea sp. (in: a-proteobacteria)]MCO5092744.1 hypothetical protein [Bosea sp. (in: a-proteobacteria)]